MKTFLKILTLFIAIGAIGGAVMMWMDPSGCVLFAENGLIPCLIGAALRFASINRRRTE